MAYRKLSDRYGAGLPAPRTGGSQRESTDAFADAVIKMTLHNLQIALPWKERDEWTGSRSKLADRVGGKITVKVELRHKCGGILCCATDILYSHWDAHKRDREEAEEFAGSLSAMLMDKMTAHVCRLREEVAVSPTLKVPKERKKAATCVLCGETDAKYPPWEGVCDHTLKERKGEERDE